MVDQDFEAYMIKRKGNLHYYSVVERRPNGNVVVIEHPVVLEASTRDEINLETDHVEGNSMYYRVVREKVQTERTTILWEEKLRRTCFRPKTLQRATKVDTKQGPWELRTALSKTELCREVI